MFQRAEMKKLNDFFTPLSQRREKSVYFCRIAGYSPTIEAFVKEYYDAARRCGVIIDGRIPNPDTNNLGYFSEMMGGEFQMNMGFLNEKLRKWLPRMSNSQRESVVTAIFSTLQDMVRSGKNENMLRNAYIKYMCWLYYKFERIVHLLGSESVPKILYDGAISNYELQFLTVLSRAGADIVLLERTGDQGYLKLDPQSANSNLYHEPGQASFPDYFSLKWILEEKKREAERQRIYGPLPTLTNCTNAWLKKADLKEVLTGTQVRGTDTNLFYNALLVQYGVEDKLLFSNDIFGFYQQLKSDKRRICLVNGGIPGPNPEEIASIKRQNYTTVEQMAAGLAQNFQQLTGGELQRLMTKAFIDLMLEEGAALSGNILKLTNKAVYLLVWMKRYYKELFSGWKQPEIGVFLLFGKCSTANEALFLRLLARLPVDVVVILPNLSEGCSLRDPSLLELRYEFSLPMESFPAEQAQMRVSTAAYQAERELDTLMYQDSGLFRNQQYGKAESVTLQTMYEEVSILWDQELKYRPSFSVIDNKVNMPVLLEKVSGVKDGQTSQYWLDIKKLITPDTIVVRNIPWQTPLAANPLKPVATQFLKNKRLQRNVIKSHRAYQYSILRPEIQDFLLDKLQLLLDQKLIAGTFQNGTEYTIVATALNLSTDLVRMIQKFDFTKKNPKVIFINTTERTLSLEDSILVAFLNLVGFDILFFVPTGYQCIERHFQIKFFNEHQIGEYLYDLTVPDFDRVHESGLNPLKKLFGRSNL